MASPWIRFGLKSVAPANAATATRSRATLAQLQDEALVAREQRAAAARERAAVAFAALMNTAELLEHLLLHVPARDLLVSQRVCRHFRDIVVTSKKLRRHLLLLPPVTAAHGKWGVVETSAPWAWMKPVRKVVRIAEGQPANANLQTPTSRLQRMGGRWHIDLQPNSALG